MAKILGINDECTTCECCGKTRLKKTVVLDVDGDVVRYGADCAAQLLLGRKSASNAKFVLGRAAAIQLAEDLLAAGVAPKDAARQVFNRTGFGSYVYAGRELWIGEFYCRAL